MACLPFSISDLVSISSGYPYPDFSSSGRKKVSKEVVPKKVEDKVSKVWVWRPKCGSSRWQRFYVVMEEAELKTFKDDKVQEAHIDGQLLVNPTRVGLKRVEICFALEKAEEHSSFLRQLQNAAQCEPQPPDWMKHNRVVKGLAQSNEGLTSDGWDSTLFCPKDQILTHLCTPGLAQSAQLLEALRASRLLLTHGRHGWDDPLELCDSGAAAFKALLLQIEGMQDALAHHLRDCKDDDIKAQVEMRFEGKEAMDAVKMWLSRLKDWVLKKVDHIRRLMPGNGTSIFASGWAVFAELTIVQLQDIEQAMQLGELLAQQCGQERIHSTSIALAHRLPRPALPYNGHWRSKIAI